MSSKLCTADFKKWRSQIASFRPGMSKKSKKNQRKIIMKYVKQFNQKLGVRLKKMDMSPYVNDNKIKSKISDDKLITKKLDYKNDEQQPRDIVDRRQTDEIQDGASCRSIFVAENMYEIQNATNFTEDLSVIPKSPVIEKLQQQFQINPQLTPLVTSTTENNNEQIISNNEIIMHISTNECVSQNITNNESNSNTSNNVSDLAGQPLTFVINIPRIMRDVLYNNFVPIDLGNPTAMANLLAPKVRELIDTSEHDEVLRASNILEQINRSGGIDVSAQKIKFPRKPRKPREKKINNNDSSVTQPPRRKVGRPRKNIVETTTTTSATAELATTTTSEDAENSMAQYYENSQWIFESSAKTPRSSTQVTSTTHNMVDIVNNEVTEMRVSVMFFFLI